MSQLATWIETLVHEVTEGTAAPRRVRLACEGTVFETWEPIVGVGLEPEQWAKDAETLVQALLPELPKRRIQLQFVAEDSAGATIKTHLRTVTGQNANAQDLGTQNGAKALADAIASVAKTADAVLETARKMMDFQNATIENQAKHLSDAHELFMAIRKTELEGEEQQNTAGKIMTEQLQQAAPLLMQLVEHWVKNAPAKVTSGGSAASAAAATTNGAH